MMLHLLIKKFGRGGFRAAALSALAVMVMPAAGHAQAVVQQLPDPAAERLSDAMRRLSRNPDSLPALVDAGRASLELDDIDAAEGFFARARAISANNGSVLAGLALIALRKDDPVAALDLFDRAGQAGESLASHAADRGLANDLIGQNVQAQSLYGQALSRDENDEVIRRLALSYAISGDQAASEAILLPLLQRRDLAAYRTRAFALAILGREDEAISIAETMLPDRLARRLTPYLRFMPRLTKPQQAAAANLGRFPTSAEIGRDDPRLARRAPTASQPSSTADSRLIPEGEPLGPPQQELPALADSTPPASAPPPPAAPVEQPTQIARAEAGLPAQIQTVQAGPAQTQPARPSVIQWVDSEPEPEPEPPARSEPVVVSRLDDTPTSLEAATSAQLPADEAAQPNAQSPSPAQPSFSISNEAPTAALVAEPEPVAQRPSLVEAFAGFELAGAASPPAASGAVDITTIVPARDPPKPEPAPAPPPPPAHPSRHWVQVATGQDIAAFRFDWRRIVRNADGLLDGRDAYRAKWNATNRLVTGPFDSTREAQQFVSQLAAKGVDAFRFTSEEGEEVERLN